MTKRKPRHEHRKRGPKPKPKAVLARRTRAVSPFLPGAKERDALNPRSRLSKALTALPDVPDETPGDLELADLPVVIPGVRIEVSVEQAAAATRTLAKLYEHDIRPYADNSRRSIRSDWRHWIAYCAKENEVAMPIGLDALIPFLNALIGAGYKRATLDHLLFTLDLASKIWNCPSPTATLEFKWYWQQQGREKLAKHQHQAASLNVENLEAFSHEVPADNARALRDVAFAAVAYDLMARASEVVAMRWEDLDFNDPDGGANYLMLRGKTDQEGKGTDTYLTAPTVVLLHAWAAHRFEENPYVFHALPRYAGQPLDRTRPLAVREASRIFDRLARRSGIAKALSGHSARVGGAQDMTRAGMELPAIMQAGRWKSPQMPARYAAKEIASRAGKNRAAALDKLRGK